MKALLLKAIGFPLLGLVATLIFVTLTFPDEKLKILVERNLEKALDHEYRVESVDFDFGLLSGVEMQQITLTPRFEFDDEFGSDATRVSEDLDPESPAGQYFCPRQLEPAPVLIDAIRVNPSWVALAGGAFQGTFAVETAGGAISGELTKEDDAQKLVASVDTVALQRFTLLRNKMGMHMVGMLGGQVDLTFGEGFKLDGGAIDLRLGGVVVCPKKFKVNMPNVPFFELPLTRLGNISGRIEVTKQRRLEFENFRGEGEDVQLEVEGSIQMATEKSPRSRYDLRIRITPEQQWVQDNAMDILFKICRRFDDGSIQFVVTGESGKVKKDCVRAQGGGEGMPPQSARRAAPTRPAAVEDFVDDSPEPEMVEAPVEEMVMEEPAPVAPSTPPAPAMRSTPPSLAKGAVRVPSKPVNAAQLRGKVKPIPEEKRREVLKVYDR